MRLQESLKNKKYIVPNEDEENENEGEMNMKIMLIYKLKIIMKLF